AENFLDLVGVRTRLPNFFGFEQNRLDGLIQNYMPLAQPSLLAAVFRLPLSLRRNGRLVRRIVRSRNPRLTHYPLVKGGVTYPYRLPTVPAFAWTALKSRAGRGYVDLRRLKFLNVVKPFVLDTIYSQDVLESSLYDVSRLRRRIECFFGGRTEFASEVDWWLAFEMWRQSLGNIDVG
ncbi:MAG: hypothetical protein OEM40_06545, partial [Acidimicrobiia bacterium]|nr:hypothetical protein [Acidimicrobiia bacterium]